MASHTRSELRWAAGVIGRAVRAVAPERAERPDAEPTRARSGSRVFDGLAEAA
jgi:hypothetical protein